MIRLIRQDMVFSGVSMLWSSLRAKGVKVTRDRVRLALRTIDPIGVALRWPAGATRHQPYSVAGPNSLWHIGKSILCRNINTDSTSNSKHNTLSTRRSRFFIHICFAWFYASCMSH